MELLWQATDADAQTKNEVYKVISGAAANYHASSEPLKTLLINKVTEMDPAEFGDKELDTVLTVCRVTSAANPFSKRTLDLLWDIIIQKGGYRESLTEKALEKFSENLRAQDKAVLHEKADACMDYIKSRKRVLVCMKVI